MTSCCNDAAAPRGHRWAHAAALETVRKEEIGALLSQYLILFGYIAAGWGEYAIFSEGVIRNRGKTNGKTTSKNHSK